MKLLSINGSPRKGNTSNALYQIRDALPGIDFEILHLKDLDFQQCKGCYACVLKGKSKCMLKEDRNMILGKIAEADGLILASPVYSHMVSAMIKNFFERFGYLAPSLELQFRPRKNARGEHRIEYGKEQTCCKNLNGEDRKGREKQTFSEKDDPL